MKRTARVRTAWLLLIVMCISMMTACGEEKEEKEEKYGDVTAYEICTAVRLKVEDFADGKIEEFDLLDPRDNSDYYLQCYGTEDFADYVSDFHYTGSATANADEVAVAVVQQESNRKKVRELFQYRKDSRIETFTGYAPEQVKKLEKGGVYTYGQYVIFLVCDNPKQALKEIERVLKPGYEPVHWNWKPTLTPTPTPTREVEPTPEPGDPNYYRGKYKDGFNPALPIAVRNGNRDALTDPQDLALYDRCRAIMKSLFAGQELTMEEAERRIYGYLVEHVAYDYDHYSLAGASLNSDNPYGALLSGLGICTGYSTSFRLLCEIIGIECINVSGTAHYDREEHGWNMAKIGPYWYYVDPCWGWNGSGITDWSFCNVTRDYMSKTSHFWDETIVPEADSMSYKQRAAQGWPEGVITPENDPTVKRIWFTE